MQKLATIYRNNELNYVYVCCLCQCAFTNVSDTLDHAESHFDEKVNITVDKNYEFVDTSKVVNETVDGFTIKTEPFEDVSEVVSETLGANRIESEYCSERDLKVENISDHQDCDGFTTPQETVCKCKLCDKTFDTTTLLIIHAIYEHTTRVPLTCPQCYRSWDNKLSFLNHVRDHMDKNEIACDVLIDKLLFVRKKIVKIRTGRRPPQTNYEPKSIRICDICQLTFPNKKEIYYHMRREHIERPTFECNKCNRKVAGKFALYAHHYGHLTDGDTVNDLDENDLQERLLKFINDNIFCDDSTTTKKFGCKLCSHSAISTWKGTKLHILQRHIHYVKKNSFRKYQCPHCYLSFAHASTLNVHQQIHEKEKQFTCSICNKAFAQQRYLKTHLITHTDTKSHQCTVCGSTFRTLIRLNYHMRTHFGVMSKCSVCGKELKKYRLKQHIRDVHENNHRPFSCAYCSQTFKTAKTLKIHAYRHTGEKKYECRLHCKEMFISAAARRSHERSKHEQQK